MENKEAREVIEALRDLMCTIQDYPLLGDLTMYGEALTLAISALKKQEEDSNKCCEICKYKNLAVSEFPCDECYFASDFEDYYEPYTEDEDGEQKSGN